jgi:hypothetical protein
MYTLPVTGHVWGVELAKGALWAQAQAQAADSGCDKAAEWAHGGCSACGWMLLGLARWRHPVGAESCVLNGIQSAPGWLSGEVLCVCTSGDACCCGGGERMMLLPAGVCASDYYAIKAYMILVHQCDIIHQPTNAILPRMNMISNWAGLGPAQKACSTRDAKIHTSQPASPSVIP